MMALIPAVDGDFTIRPGEHAIMMAQKNAKFRTVPYFGTVLKARENRTVIATVILPVEDENEAESIAESLKRDIDREGNLRLSFVRNGKTYSYGFMNGTLGLMLD